MGNIEEFKNRISKKIADLVDKDYVEIKSLVEIPTNYQIYAHYTRQLDIELSKSLFATLFLNEFENNEEVLDRMADAIVKGMLNKEVVNRIVITKSMEDAHRLIKLYNYPIVICQKNFDLYIVCMNDRIKNYIKNNITCQEYAKNVLVLNRKKSEVINKLNKMMVILKCLRHTPESTNV